MERCMIRWKIRKFIYEKFVNDNRGMGVVEIILIILVLMGLVLVFKKEIGDVITSIFGKITTEVGKF